MLNNNPQGFQFVRRGDGTRSKFLNFTKKSSTIGRDQNADIILNSKIVSRLHCKVEFDDNGRIFIESLKEKSNGVFVNDSKIVQRTELMENDVVGIGCSPNVKFPKDKEANFVYEVKIMACVELSSDEEDIDELCDELQKVEAIDAIAHGADDEDADDEDDVDACWRSKLNVNNSSSPILVSDDEASTSFVKDSNNGKDCVVKIEKLDIAFIEEYKASKGKEKDPEKEVKRNSLKNFVIPKVKKVESGKSTQPNEIKETLNPRHKSRRNTICGMEPAEPEIKESRFSVKTDSQSVAKTPKRLAQMNFDEVEAIHKKNKNSTESKNYLRSISVPQCRPSLGSASSNHDSPYKRPSIQLIDAQPMKKRRQSMYEASSSCTSSKKQKVNSVKDIFEAPSKTKISAEGTKIIAKMTKSRNEKLKIIDEKRRKDEEEKKRVQESRKNIEKVVKTVKVKVTEKNRGDFLTALPTEPAKPAKKVSETSKVPLKLPVQSEKSDISSLFRSFRDKNIRNESLDLEIKAIDFEKLRTGNGEIKTTGKERLGFYNPIISSQSPEQNDSAAPLIDLFENIDSPEMECETKTEISSNILEEINSPELPDQSMEVEDSPENLDLQQELFEDINSPETEISVEQVKRQDVDVSEEEYESYLDKPLLIPPKLLKSILKLPNKENQGPKKSVRFAKIIAKIKLFDSSTSDLMNLEVWFRQLILDQEPKTLISYEKPDSNTLGSFSSLEIYKEIVQKELKAELNFTVSKAMKIDGWHSLRLEKVETDDQGMTELELFTYTNILPSFKTKSFLLIKLKIADKDEEKQFFGYISAAHMASEFKVLTRFYHALLDDVILVKAKLVFKDSFSYMKRFHALNTLSKNVVMNDILNPNSIERCEDACNELQIRQNTILFKSILSLSDTQITRVGQVVSKQNGIVAIEGGPGTGKSKVLIASVYEIFKRAQFDKQKNLPNVLICGPSQSSIDSLAISLQRFAELLSVKLIHIGNHKNLQDVSLHCHTQILEDGNRTVNDIHQEIIDSANIITATIEESFDLKVFGKKFDMCFVDDASTCTEMDMLLPLHLQFSKLVLIGDLFKSKSSILSRISKVFRNDDKSPILLMNHQFRMHHEIFHFANKHFYDRCISNDSTLTRQPVDVKPYLVFETSHDDAIEVSIAETLARIVKPNHSIAVLAPSAHHSFKIQKTLNIKQRIFVHTVDCVQGQEMDFVIIPVTEEKELLEDPQIMNVALTRAKRCLIICGNFSKLKLNEAWNKLVQDAKDRSVFHTIGDSNGEADLIKLLKIETAE